MPHYKDPDGKILFIEEDYESSLPKGCVELERGPLTPYEELQEDNTWIENEERKSADEVEISRTSEIETTKQESGLKDISISQATNFIDGKCSSDDDLQVQIDGLKLIIKKMIPFII